MADRNHDEDDDLDEFKDDDELLGDDPSEDGLTTISLSPEDIDNIFESVYRGVELLHSVMANLYKNHQQRVVDYDVLKTTLDTKNDELKKYKDKLLEIYSQQAPKPTKRKGNKTNEL